MKIILLKSVRGLGNPGEIVNVKSGYARNYLIPNAMASYATAGNIAQTEYQIEKSKEIELKRISELEEVCKKLNKVTLKFELETSDEGKLFGSVTPQMLSEQLLDNGVNIEKLWTFSKNNIVFLKDVEIWLKVIDNIIKPNDDNIPEILINTAIENIPDEPFDISIQK